MTAEQCQISRKQDYAPGSRTALKNKGFWLRKGHKLVSNKKGKIGHFVSTFRKKFVSHGPQCPPAKSL